MTWQFGARRVQAFGSGAATVWMVADFEFAAQVSAQLPMGMAVIAAVEGVDWDRELTPWSAPPVVRGRTGFGGGADALLRELAQTAIPAVEAELRTEARWIAGYSLAGLFAVYAALSASLFTRAASVSGSMWYPGFADWVLRSSAAPERAYFSVGDRERQSRNPAFRTVEDDARRIAAALAGRGTQARFETRPGGHFQEAADRMARAIAWLAEE